MQLNKQFHVIDTENGRLLKGFDIQKDAVAFADSQAVANPAKLFAVLSVVCYSRTQTAIQYLDVTHFVEEGEPSDAESN